MDDQHAVAARQLVDYLNVLRIEAGSPSLGTLVKFSDGHLAKSTLHDHLAGRRGRLVSWELVAAYVSACRSAAASTGIDVDQLGTVQEWHTRYIGAVNGDCETPYPVRTSYYGPVTKDSDREKGMLSPSKDAEDFALAEISEYLMSQSDILAQEETMRVHEVTTEGVVATTQSPGLAWQRAESLAPNEAVLMILRGSDAGALFIIDQDLTTIGRDRQNNIVLDDVAVSRRHVAIIRRDKQFTVRDIASHNGTYVGYKSITEETVLTSGMEMLVGVFRLLFVQGMRHTTLQFQTGRHAKSRGARNSRQMNQRADTAIPPISADESY
jgi:hypothetical protein